MLTNDSVNEIGYFVPYSSNNLFVNYFPAKEYEKKPVLLIIHWMDSRGHVGNKIYNQIASYFSSHNYPVFIFDQLGSGNSKGQFEYPKKQKNQIITIYNHIRQKLAKEYTINSSEIKVIPVAHSIAGVSLMYAVNNGILVDKLIWLGGPPSHGRSIKKGILKEYGRTGYLKFRLFGYIDIASGLIGRPIVQKLFGFKVRLKDMNRHMLTSHGASMMKKRPDISILGIFGTKDEYMTVQDLKTEIPDGSNTHIKCVIIEEATHNFETHVHDVMTNIEKFITE